MILKGGKPLIALESLFHYIGYFRRVILTLVFLWLILMSAFSLCKFIEIWMSAYIAFILNFVISEWTLAALEELPLAVFQSSDFFFSLSQLRDCLSIWSPKVNKKNKLNKNCIQSSCDHFFPFCGSRRAAGEGIFLPLVGENEKITATHNLCRSCYYWKEKSLYPFPIKGKQNWPTPKFSLLSISKTLYNRKSSSCCHVLNSSICTNETRKVCKIDK